MKIEAIFEKLFENMQGKIFPFAMEFKIFSFLIASIFLLESGCGMGEYKWSSLFVHQNCEIQKKMFI